MTKQELKQLIREAISEVDWREHPAMADLYATAHPHSKYNVPSSEPSVESDLTVIDSLLNKLKSGELVKDNILRKQLMDILSVHRDKISKH